MALASSLSTRGCILPGPKDLYVQLAEVFPNPILFHPEHTLLASDFPSDLFGPGLLKVGFPSKDRSEEVIECLGLFHVLYHQGP